MNTHKLKIKSGPFAALACGAKTGEVRNCSDRNFQVGDTVELRLIDETGNPTGQEMHRRISHIQTGYGLPEEICVLSYEPLPSGTSDPVAYEFEEARFCNLVEGVAHYHGWIPRLTRDKPNMPNGSVRNIRPLLYSGAATTCPGHGRSECVSCCWPKGELEGKRADKMVFDEKSRIGELANLLTLAKAHVPITDPLRGLINANLMQHHIEQYPWADFKDAAPAPVQTCQIGIYGKAYDGPGVTRAYTYRHQPDNVGASKLGQACYHAIQKPGGDSIDLGLGLLKHLQDAGFGVFEVKP